MEKRLISVTADDVVALLNNALTRDSAAMQALVDHRVPCNEVLADHPTIQCGTAANWRKWRPNDHGLPDNAEYTVGLLGLLNGIVAFAGTLISWKLDYRTKDFFTLFFISSSTDRSRG